MAEDNFLPEDDQDFLRQKEIQYVLRRDGVGDAERKGVEFPNFPMPPNLHTRANGGLVVASTANLLVLIPKAYNKAKLDSWYVEPMMFLKTGATPQNANAQEAHFGRTWQFWSRHLDAKDWRSATDGLETYLQYIRAGLRSA